VAGSVAALVAGNALHDNGGQMRRRGAALAALTLTLVVVAPIAEASTGDATSGSWQVVSVNSRALTGTQQADHCQGPDQTRFSQCKTWSFE